MQSLQGTVGQYTLDGAVVCDVRPRPASPLSGEEEELGEVDSGLDDLTGECRVYVAVSGETVHEAPASGDMLGATCWNL
jgi:hypothetical protein